MGNITKSSPYSKDLAKRYLSWLESYYDMDWLNSRGAKEHPASKHMDICRAVVDQGGYINYPAQADLLDQLSSIVHYSEVFETISTLEIENQENLVKFYGDEIVQKKIRSRLRDYKQYEGILVELLTGAWHVLKGHIVTPLEISGWPDLKIEQPNKGLLFLIECKHIMSLKQSSIERAIKKANRQIKNATSEIGEVPGVLVLDASSILQGNSFNIKSEHVENIRRCIRNCISKPFYKSISAVLLTWSDFSVVGYPPVTTTVIFEREVQRIDHPFASNILPDGCELYEGTRIQSELSWLEERTAVRKVIFQGNSVDFDDCGISKAHIRDAILNSDKECFYAGGGREYRYFAKLVKHKKGEFYILVTAERRSDSLYVGSAFKVHCDFHETIHSLDPMEMLERLARKFGLDMQIKEEDFRVVKHHWTTLDMNKIEKEGYDSISVDDKGIDFVNILIANPDKHRYTAMIIFKPSIYDANGQRLVEYVHGVCIDTDLYRRYLRSHN